VVSDEWTILGGIDLFELTDASLQLIDCVGKIVLKAVIDLLISGDEELIDLDWNYSGALSLDHCLLVVLEDWRSHDLLIVGPDGL
jgi:hypothetical protein